MPSPEPCDPIAADLAILDAALNDAAGEIIAMLADDDTQVAGPGPDPLGTAVYLVGMGSDECP